MAYFKVYFEKSARVETRIVQTPDGWPVNRVIRTFRYQEEQKNEQGLQIKGGILAEVTDPATPDYQLTALVDQSKTKKP